MANLNDQFFREQNTNEFFDESTHITVTSSSINTGTIDTSEIAGWKQGVEIRTLSDFDAGTVKIHSADPGHQFKRTSYGLTRTFDERNEYHEIGTPASYTYVGYEHAQEHNVTSPFISFEKPTLSSADLEKYLFDGRLDPLGIATRNRMLATPGPFDQRKVESHIQSGNESLEGSSVVIDVIEIDDQVGAAFFDAPELSAARWPYASKKRSNSVDETSFSDERYPRQEFTYQTYDNELLSILSSMTASTDNYKPLQGTIPARGWTYADGIGTDSIAFGGRTY